jgi:hypothetical protein
VFKPSAVYGVVGVQIVTDGVMTVGCVADGLVEGNENDRSHRLATLGRTRRNMLLTYTVANSSPSDMTVMMALV